jgi:hypothetical protein
VIFMPAPLREPSDAPAEAPPGGSDMAVGGAALV